MDPNAAYRMMGEAYRAGDHDDARTLALVLLTWMHRGDLPRRPSPIAAPPGWP